MTTNRVQDSSKGSASFKVCLTGLVIKLKRLGGKAETEASFFASEAKSDGLRSINSTRY